MTGAEFELIFSQKIDKAYSAYLSPAQETTLFKEALYDTIREIYTNLSSQESYDDILPVIKTGAVFKLNNNKIYVSPIQISNVFGVLTNTIITTVTPHNLVAGDFITMEDIAGITTSPVINGTFTVTSFLNSANQFSVTATVTAGTYTSGTGKVSHVDDGGSTNVNKMIADYWGLLALKAKYSQTLPVRITAATNTTPVRIKTDRRNNLKTGEKINISGINALTNANGDRYVKKINTYEYDLYADKDLMNPINGNGVFGGVGTIKRIHYNSAMPNYAATQIGKYAEPTISFPKFDRGDMQIKILPTDYTCEEITADYVTIPPIEIDASNTTIDLENYYHYDFLVMVASQAAKMFFNRSKDFESLQAEMAIEQSNNAQA